MTLKKKTLAALQRAIALHQSGAHEEAEVLYRSVLRESPGHPDALHLLGLIRGVEGDNAQAIELISKAIRANPREPVFHNNLGRIYDEIGDPEKAIECFRQAIRLQPKYFDAIFKLGCAQHEAGHYSDAAESFQRALELNPSDAKTWSNLGGVLNASAQTEDALFCYRQAVALEPGTLEFQSNALFAANYAADLSAEALFALHREVGRQIQASAPHGPASAEEEAGHRKIRLGFVSGDLRSHPVGYFLEAATGFLDREAFEVHFYPTTEHRDELSQRLLGSGDRWTPIDRLDDAAAAQTIRADGIDILVDLSGHTANNRLGIFACKPARRQVAWLGYFATTGLETIDYILVDPFLCTEADQKFFTEKLFFLPETRLCFTAPSDQCVVGELPALAAGRLTFGCFNNLAKINPSVLSLWAEVMRAVPESRLILKAKALGDQNVRQRIVANFGELGVAPERLSLDGWSSRSAYFEAYNEVDIGLDPFPFTGGTTSVESLWMGVPFVTLAGDRLLSRQGVSMLANVGLADWIAASPQDYVSVVVEQARELDRLAELRRGLRARLLASPLCDGRRFAAQLGLALQQIARSGSRELPILVA